MKLIDHPTVQKLQSEGPPPPVSDAPLDADGLKALALQLGADDVGFVGIDRPELDDQRGHIRAVYPATRTLISLVCRMNREPVRSSVRSVANQEFHATYDAVNEVARHLTGALEAEGIGAVNAVSAFPMEAQEFPKRIWTVAHKPLAEAAGLGRMGIHRNLIHPKFGNFVLLGAVLIDREVSLESRPIDYNPCLECKLCVAACPVGAILPDGGFNFSACYTHNYREFLGGFKDWVETVAEAGSAADYNDRFSAGETVSLWQSLSFKPGYKAAYCISVCPAGEDVIGPFLKDRRAFREQVVKPLTEKREMIYAVPGSDAERTVKKRFPHKTVRPVRSSLVPTDIPGFLFGLTLSFQRGRAKTLSATYQFTFTGKEEVQATVRIHKGRLTVTPGLVGRADLRLSADSETWLKFLGRRHSLLKALLLRRFRLKGNPRLLPAFARCFS